MKNYNFFKHYQNFVKKYTKDLTKRGKEQLLFLNKRNDLLFFTDDRIAVATYVGNLSKYSKEQVKVDGVYKAEFENENAELCNLILQNDFTPPSLESVIKKPVKFLETNKKFAGGAITRQQILYDNKYLDFLLSLNDNVDTLLIGISNINDYKPIYIMLSDSVFALLMPLRCESNSDYKELNSEYYEFNCDKILGGYRSKYLDNPKKRTEADIDSVIGKIENKHNRQIECEAFILSYQKQNAEKNKTIINQYKREMQQIDETISRLTSELLALQKEAEDKDETAEQTETEKVKYITPDGIEMREPPQKGEDYSIYGVVGDGTAVKIMDVTHSEI